MATFVEQHYLEAMVKYLNGLDDYEYKGIAAPNWNLTNVEWAILDSGETVQSHLVKYGRRPAISQLLFAEEGFEEGYLAGLAAYLNEQASYTYTFTDGRVLVPGEWTAENVKEAIEDMGYSVEEHFLIYARRPDILNKVDELNPVGLGELFNLTTGQDTIIGTDGNDLIKGTLLGGGPSGPTTFTTGDYIDGGAGTDTLELSIGVDEANLGIATIINVENFEALIFNDEFEELNMANKSFDLATLDFNGNVQRDSVDVNNINKATDFIIKDVNLDGYSIYLNYIGAAAIDNSLTLQNVSEAYIDVDVNQSQAGGTYTLILDNVHEVDFWTETVLTLNVIVNGDSSGLEIMNYVGFDGDDAVVNLTLNADLQVYWWDLPDDSNSTTTFNITGAGNLTVDWLDDFASELTLNGATATGDIDITFGTDDVVSVTTGSGDDRIVLFNTYFVADSELVVDLGEGTDTLGISIVLEPGNVTSDTYIAALDFADVSLSRINVLEFTDAISLGDSVALDLAEVGGIEKLVFADFDANGYEFTIENAPETFIIESKGDFDDVYLAIDGVTDLTIDSASYVGIYDIDAADLTNLEINGVDDVWADLGWETGYDLSNLETVTMTQGNENEDGYAWLSLYEGVSALTYVEIDGDWAGLGVYGPVESLETVVISGGSDYYTQDAYLEVYDAESLTTATLTGIEAYVYFDNTPAFQTLDITGIEDYAYIDMYWADFGGAVSIYIGDSDVDYYADILGNNREIFKFVGEDIGDIVIEGFFAGVFGNNDRLDFSMFDGVNSLDDLFIQDLGESIPGTRDYLITSDGFEGSITLIGTVNDPTDDAANFIF